MNLDWKNYLAKIKSVDYSELYFDFLGRKSRWLIFLILLFVVISCGYIWYKYIYVPDWNEEQKIIYMNSKEKGTVFNENKFGEIVTEYKKRKENYEKNEKEIKNIFKLEEREIR